MKRNQSKENCLKKRYLSIYSSVFPSIQIKLNTFECRLLGRYIKANSVLDIAILSRTCGVLLLHEMHLTFDKRQYLFLLCVNHHCYMQPYGLIAQPTILSQPDIHSLQYRHLAIALQTHTYMDWLSITPFLYSHMYILQ